MKVLIKLGGTLLDDAASKGRLCREIAGVASRHEAVVVHGGGKQMTKFLAERGVESRFVNGLRVTSDEVLDAVLKVLAGSVNHALVAGLVAEGVPAVGLSGIDAGLLEAEQLGEEYGAVGRPFACRPKLLETLTGAAYVPVVACVAGGRGGRIFNVNADQMAASCAAGFGVDTLLFLTDVEGVRDSGGATMAELSIADCERLIAEGVATGGMQAKLTAATEALRQGVGQVVIAPGAVDGVIGRILDGEKLGSRLVK